MRLAKLALSDYHNSENEIWLLILLKGDIRNELIVKL